MFIKIIFIWTYGKYSQGFLFIGMGTFVNKRLWKLENESKEWSNLQIGGIIIVLASPKKFH